MSSLLFIRKATLFKADSPKINANVHPFFQKAGDHDEKNAIMQEFTRQMVDSYHYNRKACTYAGFPVHPFDIFKKPALTHLFLGHYPFICCSAKNLTMNGVKFSVLSKASWPGFLNGAPAFLMLLKALSSTIIYLLSG